MNALDKEILNRIHDDQIFRKALARRSFYWFFHIYFGHYATIATADFQKEIFRIIENPRIKTAVIVAFRGSGKSTISTLACPIWAMLGAPQRRFILLISQTQQLARQILTNIRQEFEHNDLLIKDFGPFSEVADEWRANSLVIPQYTARITAISSNESIRGLRHKQYRPDWIVADDVEDLESVKTKEGRDKIWGWLTGEVVPIGDSDTKMIFVGNLLHEDSLMMRLKQNIQSGEMQGIYRFYPFMDNGYVLWRSKFPTQIEIKELRSKVPSESAWYREYLLKIIADEDRIVQKDWIHYYDLLPKNLDRNAWFIAMGVDLAISEKETSDLTTLVPAIATGFGRELIIYILPFIINKRLTFPETIHEIKALSDQIQMMYKRQPVVYVENVGYQLSVVQQLIVEHMFAERVDIAGQDKRTRLNITTPYLKAGKILFPKYGAQDLINQLVNFGIEKHDDLVDAFSILISEVIRKDRPSSEPSNESPRPLQPVYRDFGDGPIDVSKPFFHLGMRF